MLQRCERNASQADIAVDEGFEIGLGVFGDASCGVQDQVIGGLWTGMFPKWPRVRDARGSGFQQGMNMQVAEYRGRGTLSIQQEGL